MDFGEKNVFRAGGLGDIGKGAARVIPDRSRQVVSVIREAAL